MTWCSKIYEIFNGFDVEDQQFAIESSLPTLTSTDLTTTVPNDVKLNSDALIQHDSPFLERSNSLVFNNERPDPLFNPDYLAARDYRGEHICADTFFSCHQRDGPYYYNIKERPYAIATISNMSLNLPKSVGNTEDKYQQQLTRSFSFDVPMEYQRAQMYAPIIDDLSTRVRYSLNQSENHRQSSTPIHQESSGYRISTRSSHSVYEYDSPDISTQNIELDVQYQIQQMFKNFPDAVFPMIYRLPTDTNDRYRIEGGYGEASKLVLQTKILPEQCQIQTENIAAVYTNLFYDQYHFNLFAIDQDSNPVVLSMKPEKSQSLLIVRTKDGSKSTEFFENDDQSTNYIQLSQQLFPDLQIEHFENCDLKKSQDFIKTFDEKLEIQKFKFAVIYQRRGQTTEEEFFNNEHHDPSLTEFLETIATRVTLKNFKGYRAGLDVSEQTESPVSYYELFEGKEIMFHVSTLLPFTPNDSTQIQRKRHIGNDIVGIVFQEENTPFHPSMIKSNFLHVFLVVQPAKVLSRSIYKIMLVSRYDIQEFSPILFPNIAYVRNAENFKSFILAKLINAEYAAYRCRTFSLLQERTRCSYLKSLCESLAEKSYENLCDEQKRSSHRRSSILFNSNRRHYLSSVKKIFTRSSTLPDGRRQSIKSDSSKPKLSKKLLRSGKSIDVDHPSNYDLSRDNDFILRQRVDSVNSNEDQRSSTIHQDSSQTGHVYFGDESDEGLDSMSSADNARLPYDSDDQDVYRKQIREKAQPTHLWYRNLNQRQISTPQTPGIHMSEASTV